MVKMFNVSIIDDNSLCIKVLIDSLSSYQNIQIKGIAQTPSTGKQIILEQHPDLLFLDVELPGISGFELLKDIRDEITWPMQVIFHTAYNEYLLDALRASAFDFLLKPIEMEEFDAVMNRFFDYARKEWTNSSFQSSLTQLLPCSSTFMIATVSGFQILHQEQIGYFFYQKDRKQWAIFLNDQSQLVLKRNTCAKDILKYSSSFVQINQQQIINIDYLAMISNRHCLLYPPFDKQDDLCITRSLLRNLQDRFNLI